jgi:hypothetical protein
MNHNTRKLNRDVRVSRFRLPDAADPRDGVRLIKAFLEIKEPVWREKLICWAEELAKASSDCRETALGEENHKRGFFGFDVLATPSPGWPACTGRVAAGAAKVVD